MCIVYHSPGSVQSGSLLGFCDGEHDLQAGIVDGVGLIVAVQFGFQRRVQIKVFIQEYSEGIPGHQPQLQMMPRRHGITLRFLSRIFINGSTYDIIAYSVLSCVSFFPRCLGM